MHKADRSRDVLGLVRGAEFPTFCDSWTLSGWRAAVVWQPVPSRPAAD